MIAILRFARDDTLFACRLAPGAQPSATSQQLSRPDGSIVRRGEMREERPLLRR